MPLTAANMETVLIGRICPGDSPRFLALLSEADERLLYAGGWKWTRSPLELTQENGEIILPTVHHSIVGARIGDKASGVRWEEIRYLEDGPSVITIEQCQADLIDEGERVIDNETRRVYSLSENISEPITVLARWRHVPLVDDTDAPRCQSTSALKQAMLSIIYEDSNDLGKSMEYFQMAIGTLDREESAYRGTARKVFNHGLTQPIKRRFRSNFA